MALKKTNPFNSVKEVYRTQTVSGNRDSFIHTFYSGFKVASATKSYKVFSNSQSASSRELTNMKEGGKLPKGWSHNVAQIGFRASWSDAVAPTAQQTADIYEFLANSNYIVGTEGKDHMGEFPISQAMGVVNVGSIGAASIPVVPTSINAQAGFISLPQVIPLEDQFNFESTFEYTGATVAAGLVGKLLIKVLYVGIASRRA